MIKYADKDVCPDCRGQLAENVNECTTCGFDLRSTEASMVWKALVAADKWVEQGRATQEAKKLAAATAIQTPSPVPPPPPMTVPSQNTFYPTVQFPPISQEPRKPALTVGNIFLILGALFVLTSGSILSALVLGVYALPLITFLAAGITIVSHTQKLRASTEMMIVITLGFYALTVGLLLDKTDISFNAYWFVWSVIAIPPSILLSYVLHRAKLPYIAQDFCVGGALLPLGLGTVALVEPKIPGYFFPVLIGLAAVAPVALFYKKLEKKAGLSLSYLALGVGGSLALLSAYLDTLLEPDYMRFSWASLLVSSILLAGGLFVKQMKENHKTLLLGYVLFQLLVIPTKYLAIESSTYAGLAFLLFGLFALTPVSHWATRGVAKAAILFVPLGMLLSIVPLEKNISKLAQAIWADDVALTVNSGLLPHWWLMLIVLAVATTAIARSAHLTLNSSAKSYVAHWMLFALPLAALQFNQSLLVVLIVVPLVALSVAGLLPVKYGSLSVLLLLPLLPVTNLGITVAALLVSAFGAIVISFMKATTTERMISYGLFGLYVPLSLIVLAEDLLFTVHKTIFINNGYAATIVACLLIMLAWLLRTRMGKPSESLGLEYGASLGLGLVYLAHILPYVLTHGTISLLFLLAGAPYLIVAMIDRSRFNVYKWVAFALLGFSWIHRLLESEIETAEAYTIPFALVFLGFGGWRMMKDKVASSWIFLGSGLVLLILPSLFIALVNDFGVRTVYVIALSAVVLSAGAYLKWQAPFILATGALVLLALSEIGPYTLFFGPLIPMGIFGVLFAVIGATWEARVRDGKAAMSFITSMR